jgi:trigger factor
MQVKELKKDGLSHELEITVTAKDIDGRVDAKLSEYAKTAKHPGFRPGKVPLSILKQRHGKAVLGEVLEMAVNDSTQKTLQDKKLRPALQPKIEVKEFDEGKDLIFTINVEVMPDFEVADLKGVKLEKPVAEVDDKAVIEALERIAAQNRDSEEVKRAAKKADLVDMDFHGRTADDNKEHPGMHAHNQTLELGGGQFIEGFEEQLIGAKAGDKVEVKVTFPEKYHAEELAGRDAIFDVKVNKVMAPKDAEVNDEFAKRLGLDDLEALKAAVKEQIQNEYDQVSRMKVKRELLDFLDDNHDFEIPAGMLDLEFSNIKQQISIESPDKVVDGKLVLDKEEESELSAISGRRVRLGMILSEIGRKNKIQVNDNELQRAVITEAQKYPGQEAQVFEYYKSNREALEALRAPVFEEKVVNFILEMAKVTEKKVTIEELTAEDEEESYTAKKKAKSAAKPKTAAKKADSKKDSDEKGEKKTPAKKKAPAKKPAAKKASDKA